MSTQSVFFSKRFWKYIYYGHILAAVDIMLDITKLFKLKKIETLLLKKDQKYSDKFDKDFPSPS